MEILREDDIRDWKGDRYSIVVNPETWHDSLQMSMVADRMIAALDRELNRGREGEPADRVLASAWFHESVVSGSGRPHLHVAVNSVSEQGRPVTLKQAQVEKLVLGAMRDLGEARTKPPASAWDLAPTPKQLALLKVAGRADPLLTRGVAGRADPLLTRGEASLVIERLIGERSWARDWGYGR